MDNAETDAFCLVSDHLQGYLGFCNVKADFPSIPKRPYRRVAWAASLDVAERAKLRAALAQYQGTKAIIDGFYSNSLVQEIGSKSNFEESCRLVLRTCNSLRAQTLIDQLQVSGVRNVDEWSRDLEKRYEYDVEFGELYLEGRYALTLQKNGLEVQLKPYGDERGADLQVSVRGLLLDVEISHFRRDEGLEQEMSGQIVEMPCRTQALWSKLEEKKGQLQEGKNGVILLSSDNIGIDDIEFQKIAETILSSGLAEKLCAIVFSDSFTRDRAVLNPRARIPGQELHAALRAMFGTLAIVA